MLADVVSPMKPDYALCSVNIEIITMDKTRGLSTAVSFFQHWLNPDASEESARTPEQADVK